MALTNASGRAMSPLQRAGSANLIARVERRPASDGVVHHIARVAS